MYDRGYRLGFMGAKEFPGTTPKVPYLNNHLRFIIKYHKDEKFEGARIVGFEVEAFSVQHKYKGTWGKDAQLTSVPLSPDLPPQPVNEGPGEFIFTYDVTWEESAIRWASRWDLYLYMGDDQIHWFSILNSLAIVLLLTGIVAMIMMRTLRRDLNRYNSVEEKEALQEESGWKLVHADVLRPPALPLLLSASIGTGMQLLTMGFIAIFGALLGFLSPANRGGLLSATLLLFTLMGVPAGYFGSTHYKMMRGAHWKTLTLMTALLFPGIVFLLFFTLNFFIWGRGSSGAAPFGTILALISMWFCISVPLVFLGAFIGFRQKLSDPPVRTNEIPRQVPEQSWYMGTPFTMVVGGILPFGAVFIELFFIMSSVWLQRFYYVFGFLALVMAILLITCAEISIVLCYFQLCNEDYNWWWRSFLNSGAAGLYLFGYAFVYFFTQLEMVGFVPCLVYFGYMLIASLVFVLVTGTVGFLASFWFVWKIFEAVKVD
jgi:transmembrane 9 superfamily protein 2/4